MREQASEGGDVLASVDHILKTVQADLAPVEARRWLTLAVLALALAACLAILAAWFNGLSTAPDTVFTELRGTVVFFGPVVPLVLLAFLCQRAVRAYARLYKQVVVPRLLRELAPQLQYDPEGLLPGEVFEQSRYAPGHLPRTFLGRDLLQGSVAGRPLRASHLRVLEETTDVVFNGMLCELGLRTRVRGHVVLTPGKGSESFGALGKAYRFAEFARSRGLPVHIDDPSFSRQFTVYASDEDLARQLLTPDLQARLIHLADALGRHKLGVSYVQDHLYVAIRGAGWFNAPLFQSARSGRALGALARDLQFLASLTSQLDPEDR